MTKIRSTDNSKGWRGCGAVGSLIASACANWYNHFENFRQHCQILNICMPCDPEMPHLSTDSTKISACVQECL